MSKNTEQSQPLVQLATMPVSILPIELIDPDPEQPRQGERDVSDLARNMARAGQLHAVAVRSTEDGRYRLVFGEGRLLAARSLEWEGLAAYVLDGLSAAEVAAIQLAENMQRHDLTGVEAANGVQRVLDLGGSVELAANATATEAEVIQRAHTARQQIGEGAPTTLTLEQYGALDEFAHDRKAVAALTKAAAEGQFAYKAAEIRHRRTVAARKAVAKSELEAAGIPIVKYDYMGPNKPLAWVGVNPDQHASCPGHAAWIDREGFAGYVCTQPHLHGHGQSPEQTAEREAEKARRAESAALLAEQYEIATPLRLEWLAGYVAGGTFTAPALNALYGHVWDGGIRSGDDQSAEAFREVVLRHAKSREKRFVGQVLVDCECDLRGALRDVWRLSEAEAAQTLNYFRLLKTLGYKPTEGDTTLREALNERLAARSETAA
jgi:ParB-like chromosome segregation protein Spo0J